MFGTLRVGDYERRRLGERGRAGIGDDTMDSVAIRITGAGVRRVGAVTPADFGFIIAPTAVGTVVTGCGIIFIR